MDETRDRKERDSNEAASEIERDRDIYIYIQIYIDNIYIQCIESNQMGHW